MELTNSTQCTKGGFKLPVNFEFLFHFVCINFISDSFLVINKLAGPGLLAYRLATPPETFALVLSTVRCEYQLPG